MLQSIEFVSIHSDHVTINTQAIDHYCEQFVPVKHDHWLKSYPLGPLPFLSFEQQLDLFFLMGSQAFCFWGNPKWTIEYKGKKLDGWWALVACFHRAIEQGVPILDGHYWASFDEDRGHSLFDGIPIIPLFSERVAMLRSIGEELIQHHSGYFHVAFKNINPDAESFLELLSTFEGFKDQSLYKGHSVRYDKKSQVVICDIDELLRSSGKHGIEGIDRLPGHADYKIPARLRALGILKYDTGLSEKIDSMAAIPRDSEFENEIRSNQLWAIHLIIQRLSKKYPSLTATSLNGMLWVQSQTKLPDEKPYHRTKTVCY